MDLNTFMQRRREECERAPTFRRLCLHCMQPDFSCYCHWLKPFDCDIRFVILIHPIEFKKRIATGRMAHLSLRNSRLIMGLDYTRNNEVNALIENPELHCVMLYPGRQSLNLTPMSVAARRSAFPERKQLTVFVIDGSWSTARKMVRLSQNVKSLPRICFTPTIPSNFRVRRQPRRECYSTIEAIHQTIDLFEDERGNRDHDRLLDVFDRMVNRQIELTHSKDAFDRPAQG